jgi:hypothetical protein
MRVDLRDAPDPLLARESVAIMFFFNNLRRLAKAELQVHAQTFLDAERFAHDIITN